MKRESLTLSALLASALLAACGSTTADEERQAEQAGTQIEQGAERAGQAAEEAARDAGRALENAADRVQQEVNEAAGDTARRDTTH